MKAEAYNLIVEWSSEDECYLGTCPELFEGGCHGDNKDEVHKELKVIIEDVLADFKAEGKEPPQPSARAARISTALPARSVTRLNQKQFAQSINVPVTTVQNWEQGRSKPKGATQTLLRLIESKPTIIHELYKLTSKGSQKSTRAIKVYNSASSRSSKSRPSKGTRVFKANTARKSATKKVRGAVAPPSAK